jgi:hypothetical protein
MLLYGIIHLVVPYARIPYPISQTDDGWKFSHGCKPTVTNYALDASWLLATVALARATGTCKLPVQYTPFVLATPPLIVLGYRLTET